MQFKKLGIVLTMLLIVTNPYLVQAEMNENAIEVLEEYDVITDLEEIKKNAIVVTDDRQATTENGKKLLTKVFEQKIKKIKHLKTGEIENIYRGYKIVLVNDEDLGTPEEKSIEGIVEIQGSSTDCPGTEDDWYSCDKKDQKITYGLELWLGYYSHVVGDSVRVDYYDYKYRKNSSEWAVYRTEFMAGVAGDSDTKTWLQQERDTVTTSWQQMSLPWRGQYIKIGASDYYQCGRNRVVLKRGTSNYDTIDLEKSWGGCRMG